jgi:hypothetical protein
MNPDNTSGIKTWQWVVTIIVIIVLIIIGIMVFGGKGTEAPIDVGTTTPPTGTPSLSQNRIVIGDQYPGNVINVSSVQLVNGGWVVIHKNNNGQPGAIIGQTYFDAGINTGRVTLSQVTVEGGTYYAMLHSDDGDKKFDAAKDLPLKDSAGNIIMQIFHASALAGSEIKG